MIRTLQDSDLLAAARGGQRFYDEAGLPGSLDPAVFARNWSALLASGSGRIFGSFDENGTLQAAIGGLVHPDLNNGDMVVSEAFWFSLPEARRSLDSLRLLRIFVEWGKALGASRILMVHLSDLNAETLSRLYRKLGFRELERHYVLEV